MRATFLRKIWVISVGICALSPGARAEPRLAGPPEPYRDGPARLAQAEAAQVFTVTPAAKLGFVEVPLDYARPARGVTKIFYRLPRAFDPALPTMLYFYGGPGGSSLSALFERSLKNFNLVYFDQRGTGYSYLPTRAAQMDPANFSSENSARDGAAVLESLGVKQAGVYGHSYGTVVATIYAHLFPERVTGLVLEGVVYDGGVRTLAGDERRRLIQGVFEALPAASRARVLRLGQGTLAPDWFSRIVKPAMYEDNFGPAVAKHLAELLAKPDEELKYDVADETYEDYLRQDTASFGAVMYHQISCQELSLGHAEGGWASRFDINGRLRPAPNADAAACAEIPGMVGRMDKPYLASRFPVRAPLTYIQGETDGATPLAGALTHFARVPRGSAQFLLVKNGGHTPALERLFERPEVEYRKEERERIAALVEQALAGKPVSEERAAELGWQLRRR